MEPESAFVPLLPSMKAKLPEVLCLKAERTVGNDNCVAYRGRKLQIPPQRHRCHYVHAKVSVHEYEDGGFAVFHGTLRLGRYDASGRQSGQGRGGRVRASAALLGSLRSPRRAAEPKSGHFTCSENRPLYLLPTAPALAGCEGSLRPLMLPSIQRFMNKTG